ncbi:MAG: GIY-YIG nuclease family protein [Gammaproteobacteria bacterium]|nr:GIY-YIG nuclease family protein [Gammaproteobacteria bacterium]
MNEKCPCVYLLANKPFGTLYIGVTSDLKKRIWQHKNNLVEGFSNKYKLHRLVWFELHLSMYAAIDREKNLKNWNREWKINLLEKANPNWRDLYPGL